MAPPRTVAGIFVGGASRRMGGAPKGLLRAPGGETIAVRTARVLAEAGLEVVLVGDASAYASLGLAAIPDAVAGIGPLGALVALLNHAGAARAIAIACDMPYVSTRLVEKLARAPSGAPIVAPWRHGRWEPLFARYDAARVLPIAEMRAAERVLALQGLLDVTGAEALEMTPDEEEELRDWDTPDDALLFERP